MPKRVLDGDAMWASSKLAKVQPAWTRAEYPWLYPLARANGVFELDVRAILARCYTYVRPEKSIEDLKIVFDAFVQAKLLFVWEQDGKMWGYWVGSDKPGRLPRKSWREREAKNGTLPPDPPGEDLRRFLSTTDEAQETLLLQPERDRRAENTPEACRKHAASVHGFGSGFGTGLGVGEVAGSKTETRKSPSKPTAKPEAIRSPVAFQSPLFEVNQAQDTKLEDTYPWVDRLQEYKKMALWLEAHRPGRKVKNTLAFCQNWFNKIPCPAQGGNNAKPSRDELVRREIVQQQRRLAKTSDTIQ